MRVIITGVLNLLGAALSSSLWPAPAQTQHVKSDSCKRAQKAEEALTVNSINFSPPASSRRCGAESIDVSRCLKPLYAKCSVLLLQSDCLFLMKWISSTCPPWNNIISLRSNWLPKTSLILYRVAVFTNKDLVCSTAWIYIICLAGSHKGQKPHCQLVALLMFPYITCVL